MACLCAVLVGAGILLIARYFALKKRNLRALDAEVVNICTIKPLDEELIVKTASKTGKVVTAALQRCTGSACATSSASPDPLLCCSTSMSWMERVFTNKLRRL